MFRYAFLILPVLWANGLTSTAQAYTDLTHPSTVMGEARHFRLFLPPAYETSGKRYPVIYYFHGHSDRYTVENMDKGKDIVPKMAAFVRNNDVIVVTVDGYVARDYTGFYGGSPWDVRIEGGQFDFGAYFLELIAHIDGKYRTLTDRRHRAISGLSMGGFMSAYLSARYPSVLGSASIFNPGPEFFAGEPGRRSLWRPKDHVANHEHTMVRLIRASGDYISQYHEETRAAYASSSVDFEFRQDEYHRHWATSIAETFAFHMRAFNNAALDAPPKAWSYTSAFRAFDAWDYRVDTNCAGPALISLESVSPGTFRTGTRQWAPDGPAADCSSFEIRTGPAYRPGASYRVLDYDDINRKLSERTETAGRDGRLTIRTSGGIHQLSVLGPGIDTIPPVLLPISVRANPGVSMTLPIRLYNPAAAPLENLTAVLSSQWPTVKILQAKADVPKLASGAAVDLSRQFQVRFTAGDGDFARARLRLTVTAGATLLGTSDFDVLIAPDGLTAPLEVKVLDGREEVFPIFRQQGNQGGGATIQRTVREGKGNGNGVFEPGEEATIWLRLKQGIDPFDKNNWCRAKVYPESAGLVEIGDLQETKQTEWTGAQNRISLLRRSAGAPVPVILDCESYSYHWTPDVRYGRELLYQPFQVHRHHLFRWTLP